MSGGGPYLTWNLFLTLLLIPIAVFTINLLIKRSFTKFTDGWAKYEELKEKNLEERWERYSSNLCSVKTLVEKLVEKLGDTVSSEDYEVSSSEIFNRLNSHGNRISILETKVCDLRNKENVKH